MAKKRLRSAKYKTKIEGYEAALQSLQPLTRNLK